MSLKWYQEISRNDGHVYNEKKWTIFICKQWTCPNSRIIEQAHMFGQKSSCMWWCWLIRMTKSTTCDSCFCFFFSFLFPPISSHLIRFDFLIFSLIDHFGGHLKNWLGSTTGQLYCTFIKTAQIGPKRSLQPDLEKSEDVLTFGIIYGN